MRASDEFYLRVAKTVVEGAFEKVHFRKKPLRDLFPTKKTCPHCGGRRRKVWDLVPAWKLLDDMVGLARQIKQRKLCLSCLGQLSEIARRWRECLGGWDKEDSPRSSLEEGKPKVSVSRSELRKPTPELDEQMQAIMRQEFIHGHMYSDCYHRVHVSHFRTREDRGEGHDDGWEPYPYHYDEPDREPGLFEVEIANGGKRIRLRPRHLDSMCCSRYSSRCKGIYEEWELTPDGRIFLTYCEEEYDDEAGVTTGHRRRRREVVWDSQRKEFRFPPGLLDKVLDPVADAVFKPIEGVLRIIGKAIKTATWFVYCRCPSPDPYLAKYDEGTPVYKCRRCENFVDR